MPSKPSKRTSPAVQRAKSTTAYAEPSKRSARRSTAISVAVPLEEAQHVFESDAASYLANMPFEEFDVSSIAHEDYSISENLDLEFYRNFYADLLGLSPSDLVKHWRSFGSQEGRFPSMSVWLAQTDLDLKTLPEDFSIGFYRNLNPDLNAVLNSNFDFLRHFLTTGVNESRKYSLDQSLLISTAENPQSQLDQDYLTLQAIVGDKSATKIFETHGIYSGDFLKLFNVDDYQARVGVSVCKNRLECIFHFISIGQYKNYPISSEHYIDQVFYAEFAPETSVLSHVEAYRHWLNKGVANGFPVNPSQLMSEIGLTGALEMPDGFDWKVYLNSNPDLAMSIDSPWRALQHYARKGIAEGRPGCLATESTAPLYVAAADRLAMSNELSPARQLYETALLAAPTHTRGLRHYADCLMKQGDLFGAVTVYRRTIKDKRYNAWTFLNLSSCLLRLNRRIEAIEVLKELTLLMPGDQYIRDRYLQVSEECFNALSSDANRLANAGLVDEARLKMEAAVSFLAGTVPAAAPRPLRIGAIRRIGIVADMSIPQCKHYRVLQKSEHLIHAGFQIEIFDQAKDLGVFHTRLPFLDCVIFYRVAALPAAVRAFRATRIAGIPTVYDIDDLIFDADHFPDSFESYGGLISRQVYGGLVTGTALFSKGIELSDFAMSSTTTLANEMLPLVAQHTAFVHRNALDAVQETMFLNIDSQAALFNDGERPVRIFYGTGTRAHNEDFELFAVPALIRLLEEYGPLIQVVIAGYITLPESMTRFEKQVIKIDQILDKESYWHLLKGMDINIAVLKPGIISDCKSEIKWMEAAMLAIPSVVSETATYKEVISHGKTGFLAKDVDDWYKYLNNLIKNPSIRKKIGADAKLSVKQKYSTATSAQNIRNIVTSIEQKLSLYPTKANLRVLVVNVFFPPQAIGGATRVVADNVADLQRNFGKDVEIEVFTSIEGGQIPYEMRSHQWNGVKITGVTTPVDPDIDLRTSDKEMARAFGSYLDHFKPHIVHFHCIQRLTVSICSEATSRNIPYVITVHDAWWISKSQFLLDKNNNFSIYKPKESLSEIKINGVQHHVRMQELLTVLTSAKRVLAVSKSFANLYRDYGIANVSAVENGVSNIEILPRRPKASSVRIAHIGGKSFHKGYNILKLALCESNFHNIELLLIDHAMSEGEEVVTKWGASNVKIRGKYSQSKIAELYASIDVLAAPSVWPESYGLVVREAIQAGCWVIASDRGALADEVDDSCGFVVPVDDYHELKDVLDRINSNPAQFTAPPQTSPKLRTSDQQAKELLSIYREFARKD
ncbi:glycosyltransferase [Acidisoma cellulosilytica]|uniref:Glycosyltransferase n=1 Tax=Acidisoma cellulosilyticum TaxID=2802395 RepID=A0A963Z8N8_9PROT|nr:glycosyltransferase [Acidisoma cellulosilyticum]MCB8884120.1 glycosyltransferase [Acidisoma cellulosilyticum]